MLYGALIGPADVYIKNLGGLSNYKMERTRAWGKMEKTTSYTEYLLGTL